MIINDDDTANLICNARYAMRQLAIWIISNDHRADIM